MMRGIIQHEDFAWSNAPRGSKGGGTSTTTTNNAPPQQYLDAYSNVMNLAQNAANQPLQQYPGTPQSLIAGFSPDQMAAFGEIEGAQNIEQPYINTAAQYMQAAGQPFQTQQFQDYLQQGAGPQVTNAAQSGAQGILGQMQMGQYNVGQAGGAGVAGIQNAGQAGTSGIQNASQQATQGILGAGMSGAGQIAGAGQQGVGGIMGAGQQGTGAITSASQSYQPGQIPQWMSPYTQNVVDATQSQFNNQNQQAQNQLRGNAASQGALGGDRLGVAQATLANQQQLAQAPTIANLYQQGYTQAEQAALQQSQLETQGATAAGQLGLGAATSAGQLGLGAAQGAAQTELGAQTSAGQIGTGAATSAGQLGLGAAQGAAQTGLSAASTGAQLGMSGAQGAGAMGLQGATTQSQLQQQAAQQILGANEAQGWLNSGLGYGMASLGNQAQNSTLTGAGALMGVGGQEQQMAQQYLNIPYEQWVAQQSYPFQSTGWLANIAEGLGSSAGGTGTGTSTVPGPSAASQIAGAGMTGVGMIGATGGFGNNGWLTGTNGLFGSGSAPDTSGAWDLSSARGGRIPHRALGGGGLNMSPAMGGSDPTSGMHNIDLPSGGGEDVSLSIIPQGASPRGGQMDIMKNYGQTSETTGGGSKDSIFGSLLKTAGTIAAGVYGGPAGGAAASALSSQVHFDRGGRLGRGFADGGTPISAPIVAPQLPATGSAGKIGPAQVSMLPASYAGGISVPQLGVGTGSGTGTGATSGTGSGTGSGTKSGSSGSFNDYLTSVMGQIPTKDQINPPKPTAAAPAGPSQTDIDAMIQAALLKQQKDAAQQPVYESRQEGGGSDDGMRFGGRLGRGFAEGGGIDDDQTQTIVVTPDGTATPAFNAAGVKGPAGSPSGPTAMSTGAGYQDPPYRSPPQISTAPPGKTLGERLSDTGQWWHDLLGVPKPKSAAAATTPLGTGITAQPVAPSAPSSNAAGIKGLTGSPSGEAPLMAQPVIPSSPSSNVAGMKGAPGTQSGAPLGAGMVGGKKTPDGPAAQPAAPGTTSGLDDTHSPAAPGTGQTYDAEKGDAFLRKYGMTGMASSVDDDAKSLHDRVNGAKDTVSSKGFMSSPWMSLVAAGLGTMGGTSPWAGVNIGRGGLEGVKFGEKQRETEAAEDLRAQQAKELSDYHRATSATANRRIDVTSQLNDAKIAAMQYRSDHPKATLADLQQQAALTFQNTINPATGANYTPAEAFDHIKGIDFRWAGLAETTEHHRSTEAASAANFNQRVQQAAESAEAKAAQLKANADSNTMNTAAKNYLTAQGTAKPLTWDEAIAGAIKGRATVSGTSSTAAPTLKPMAAADLTALNAQIASNKVTKEAAIAEAKRQGFDTTGIGP